MNLFANLKSLGVIGAIAIIGCVIALEFRGVAHRHDSEKMVWFYDESEKQLYSMPVTTMPPDKGIGGQSGDGYRAIVVGFAGYKHDKSKRKVAYLEKYSSDLKRTLDEVMAARAAGHIFTGSVTPRQSQYFQNNTLVKRQGDTEWFPVNTEEGQRIMNEWRSWRGPDGGGAVVCAVD